MSIPSIKRLFCEECIKYRSFFINNGAGSDTDLWKDGMHLIESGKLIVANNFINYFNNILQPMNHPIWQL